MSVTSKIVYEGELRTRMVHLQSGTAVITDAPTDNHGKGEAFSPTDLVATALGSCMISLIGIKLKLQGRDNELVGTEVEIRKVMYSEPRRIGEVYITLRFAPNHFSDKDKVMLENVARTCPVALSLHPDITQHITFIW
ncbi:MAG: OsmC family protein [Bacteroidetes bacterium]|nr:OsmC family protein [Bacteroidota bacterium]MBK8657589.1 OsmC family protein [Bacteroidota bacterium]